MGNRHVRPNESFGCSFRSAKFQWPDCGNAPDICPLHDEGSPIRMTSDYDGVEVERLLRFAAVPTSQSSPSRYGSAEKFA
jgi:hypothetical protein